MLAIAVRDRKEFTLVAQILIYLIAAGIPVELRVVPGAYHAFDLIATNAALTHEFRAVQLGALRRAFA